MLMDIALSSLLRDCGNLLESLFFQNGFLTVLIDLSILAASLVEPLPDVLANDDDCGCDQNRRHQVDQYRPKRHLKLVFFFFGLAKVLGIELNSFFGTQFSLDERNVACIGQETPLLERFFLDDLVDGALQNHQVVDSLLAVNHVEVLFHQLSGVFFCCTSHFVLASASLLEAPLKLRLVRVGKLCQGATMCNALLRAIR